MKRKPLLRAEPITFKRANPDELALFDPSTKLCAMNCGPHADDPRSAAERKFLCDDCIVEPKTIKENQMQVTIKGVMVKNGKCVTLPSESEQVEFTISNLSLTGTDRTEKFVITVRGEEFAINSNELVAGLSALQNVRPT